MTIQFVSTTVLKVIMGLTVNPYDFKQHPSRAIQTKLYKANSLKSREQIRGTVSNIARSVK